MCFQMDVESALVWTYVSSLLCVSAFNPLKTDPLTLYAHDNITFHM